MNADFIKQRARFKSATMKRLGVTDEAYTNVTNLLATIAQPFHVRKGEFLHRAGTPATQVHWLASGAGCRTCRCWHNLKSTELQP